MQLRPIPTCLSLATASLLLTLSFPVAALAQPYSAKQVGDVVRLEDRRAETMVAHPAVGGQRRVRDESEGTGRSALARRVGRRVQGAPGLSGIPFLAPWANRLDEQAFYANGKRYAFDMALGNVRGTIPIHGFLTLTDQWQVVEANADGTVAWVTSRLEFYRSRRG